MNAPLSSLASRAARAFSLIEVLIAVLVLSLGLLGLAAVFPVVIAQQRDAVDRTRGAVVAETVQKLLESSENLVSFRGLRRDFWFSAADELEEGSGYDLDAENMSFLWEPTWMWGPPSHWAADPLSAYLDVGSILVGFGKTLNLNGGSEDPDPELQYELPVTARLFPQPYTGEQPQYVWDIVPRRVRIGSDTTGLELAVFIRRIDPGIRVPRGNTLSDVLTGHRVAASEVRLPVGMDPLTQLPTGNGADIVPGGTAYSVPLTLPVVVRSGALNIIELDSSNQTERDVWSRSVAAPGQILVDNLGHVLNVVRVPESDDGVFRLEVDHTYARSEADYTPGVDPRGVKVEQILFTLQKPVRVFTYRADW
ncbi:MAG: prepilin-type N-terminal cleavage/methylation domain-containing protein [Planctomycetota bacterium]|nr:MAG: prepilin-type N-terminal cleavage/methylation domain-containing protein [Planctomycetota bacterium]